MLQWEPSHRNRYLVFVVVTIGYTFGDLVSHGNSWAPPPHHHTSARVLNSSKLLLLEFANNTKLECCLRTAFYLQSSFDFMFFVPFQKFWFFRIIEKFWGKIFLNIPQNVKLVIIIHAPTTHPSIRSTEYRRNLNNMSVYVPLNTQIPANAGTNGVTYMSVLALIPVCFIRNTGIN